MDGGKFEGSKPSSFWKHHRSLLRSPLNMTLVLCIHFNMLNLCTEPILRVSLLLWVTWRNSQYPLHHHVLVHVMFLLLCLSVQGKYLPRESAITNILFQYLCQSMFIWPTSYISVFVSCGWWGIHQSPPVTILFLSTSTHYPGTRLRNHLVP